MQTNNSIGIYRYHTIRIRMIELAIHNRLVSPKMAEGQDKPSTEEYSKQLREWYKKKNNFPGAFRMDIAEAMWAQCKGVQIPLVSELPVLTLPLRIHLAQGPELGCSITMEECFTELVPIMNEFWTQAGIVWDLIEVAPVQWPNDVDGSRKTIECARKQITLLVRDHSTGKMTNKDLRRSIFIDTLIPNAALSKETYDVYMFDVIGEESQGDTLLISLCSSFNLPSSHMCVPFLEI